MLGIFLFVFCRAPQDLATFPSGLHGYWDDMLLAAAVAQDVKTAKGYLGCLANSAVEITVRKIGQHEVSGQDHQGGALLTVPGYKIFVANVLFAEVLEYHINSLINSYNLLAGKASSLATSARSSSSPAASTSTLSPTASGGQPTTSGPAIVPPPPSTITTSANNPQSAAPVTVQPTTNANTPLPATAPTTSGPSLLPASGGQPATTSQAQMPDPATSAATGQPVVPGQQPQTAMQQIASAVSAAAAVVSTALGAPKSEQQQKMDANYKLFKTEIQKVSAPETVLDATKKAFKKKQETMPLKDVWDEALLVYVGAMKAHNDAITARNKVITAKNQRKPKSAQTDLLPLLPITMPTKPEFVV